MTTLIRYNLNKNLGVMYDKSFIKKFVVFNNNIKNFNSKILHKEYDGCRWYINQLKKKKKFYFSVTKGKNFLKFQIIKGYQYKFWKNFIHKKDLVFQVLNHYKKVWPKKSLPPFHGDLTLDNIIFLDNKDICLIDWENYRKKETWGLDICYFLISIIVLPILVSKNKILSEKNLSFFKLYWSFFFKKKKYKYIDNPILYIQKKIKNRNHFFFKIEPAIKKQILKAIKEVS